MTKWHALDHDRDLWPGAWQYQNWELNGNKNYCSNMIISDTDTVIWRCDGLNTYTIELQWYYSDGTCWAWCHSSVILVRWCLIRSDWVWDVPLLLSWPGHEYHLLCQYYHQPRNYTILQQCQTLHRFIPTGYLVACLKWSEIVKLQTKCLNLKI